MVVSSGMIQWDDTVCVCVEEGVGRLLGVRVAERKGRQQGGANVCACREGRTLFFAEVRVVERSSTGGRRGSGGQSQCRTSTNGCVEPRLCMRHGSKNQGFFAVDAHRCVCSGAGVGAREHARYSQQHNSLSHCVTFYRPPSQRGGRTAAAARRSRPARRRRPRR